jgi:hypothetical protein
VDLRDAVTVMVSRNPAVLVLTALVLVGLGGGCPGEPNPPSPAEPVPLASPDAWERVSDPSVDVFADQRPADAVCDDAGWSVDPFKESIEIQTEVCDYLTLHQPTLEPLEPGDVVTVVGYHDVLSAPEPAEGYIGLALDGELAWEFQVPIPADAAEFEEEFTVDRSVPVASEMQLHLHNHGPNTWELIAVTVTRGD